MTLMMRIEQIKQTPDRVGRHLVSFDDGSSFRLYRQTIEDHRLYAGKELTSEEYEKLAAAEQKMSAKMRAVRIISAANISEKQLQERLVQKGESPEASREAVGWLKEMDLVDDQKTAEHLVACCIEKGYGLARAKQILFEKRIPRELWSQVLADYPDQQDAILEYLRTRVTDINDQKALKRSIDALMRRGHSYGSIRAVLNSYMSDFRNLMEDE